MEGLAAVLQCLQESEERIFLSLSELPLQLKLSGLTGPRPGHLLLRLHGYVQDGRRSFRR